MTTSRLPGRRGDGSAVVDGWVAAYTLGLPAAMRRRRREELAAHLADERADAIRRGELHALRRRRLVRWLAGIPDDILWRLTDARAMGRRYPGPGWVPLSRWTSMLLGGVAIGAVGGFVLVGSRLLAGEIGPTTWASPAPQVFLVACGAIATGIALAVPWPRAGAGLVAIGALVGVVIAPWLWGCWGMAAIAVALRWQQAADGDGIRS
jgi:hypothetical protein